MNLERVRVGEPEGPFPVPAHSTFSENRRTRGKSPHLYGIHLPRIPSLPPNEHLFRSPSRLRCNLISP